MTKLKRTKRKSKHNESTDSKMAALASKYKLKQASARTTKSGHRTGMTKGLKPKTAEELSQELDWRRR
jgi:hypothetical protein